MKRFLKTILVCLFTILFFSACQGGGTNAFVTFKIDKGAVQKILNAAENSNESFTSVQKNVFATPSVYDITGQADLEDLSGYYLIITLQGDSGYSAKETARIYAEQNNAIEIRFDDVPVGESLSATGEIYLFGNGEYTLLYKGTSPKKVVTVGKNALSLVLKRVFDENIINPVVSEDFIEIQGADIIGVSISGSSIFTGPGSIVSIKKMYVCNHEVTQAEYKKYCIYGKINGDQVVPTENSEEGQISVYNVSWYDAVVYCNLRSLAEGLNPVYYITDNERNVHDPKEWDKIESKTEDKVKKYCAPDYDDEYGTISDFDWEKLEFYVEPYANGYRLPTEAEWEYLASFNKDGEYAEFYYSGSNDIKTVAWYGGDGFDDDGNSDGKVHAIKERNPNSFGIYDMTGNVREWCNNFDAVTGIEVKVRGGSYNTYASACYNYSTAELNKIIRDSQTGFRVIRYVQ